MTELSSQFNQTNGGNLPEFDEKCIEASELLLESAEVLLSKGSEMLQNGEPYRGELFLVEENYIKRLGENILRQVYPEAA